MFVRFLACALAVLLFPLANSSGSCAGGSSRDPDADAAGRHRPGASGRGRRTCRVVAGDPALRAGCGRDFYRPPRRRGLSRRDDGPDDPGPRRAGRARFRAARRSGPVPRPAGGRPDPWALDPAGHAGEPVALRNAGPAPRPTAPAAGAARSMPLEDRVHPLSVAAPRPDGSFDTVLRNPERDIGTQMGAQRLVREGETVRLMGRRGNAAGARARQRRLGSRRAASSRWPSRTAAAPTISPGTRTTAISIRAAANSRSLYLSAAARRGATAGGRQRSGRGDRPSRRWSGWSSRSRRRRWIRPTRRRSTPC